MDFLTVTITIIATPDRKYYGFCGHDLDDDDAERRIKGRFPPGTPTTTQYVVADIPLDFRHVFPEPPNPKNDD